MKSRSAHIGRRELGAMKRMNCLRLSLRLFFSATAVLGWCSIVGAAPAPATTIRVGYPQLNGGQVPLWNIAETNIDQKYGLDVKPVYIPGGVRLTQSAVSGAVDIAMTGGAAVNAMLSGADFIYVGMPVPTYAFSLYGRPEIKQVTDLRARFLASSPKERHPITRQLLFSGNSR